MSDERVRIVTDGSIDLPLELIQELGIAIVPCLVQAGRKTYESNAQTPLRAIAQVCGGQDLTVVTPSFSQFFTVYQSLGKVPIISIHGSHAFNSIGVVARVARNVVVPVMKVQLFEASTIDLGVSFLVEVAARAALEGYEQDQIVLALRRLQQERMATFIVRRSLGEARKYITEEKGLLTWLKRRLPFMEHLLSVDQAQNSLLLLSQGTGLAKGFAGQSELFADLARPSDLWVRQRGYDEAVNSIRSNLAPLLQSGECRVENGGSSSPIASGTYMEVVVVPPPEVVEQVKKFVRRMWKAFGPGAAVRPQ
jgi:hypothetical protein